MVTFTFNADLLGPQPDLNAAFYAASCLAAQHEHGVNIWSTSATGPDGEEAYLVRPAASRTHDGSMLVAINGVPPNPEAFRPSYRVERILLKEDR